MKALLIISIPEDFDYRKCKIGGDGNIYYERKGEQRVSIIGNIKNLKPMPSNLDWRYINETTNTDSFEYGRCCGRQEIIDEILGE